MPIKNNYSYAQKLQLSWWLLRTKLLCSKARLIRFPLDLRGRKSIDLGVGLTTGVGCRLEAFADEGIITMRFGRNVQMNDYVHISAMKNVSIGSNVLIAGHVYISDNSHGNYRGTEQDSNPDTSPTQRVYRTANVVIEENVWLGEGVVVLPGVTIGRGAIVGANAVVSKNIEAYTIAVGQPARAIKIYNHALQKWKKI